MTLQHEFAGVSKSKARANSCKYELKAALIRRAKRIVRRQSGASPFVIRQRYLNAEAKAIVIDEGLAIANGQPPWFYTAFERGGLPIR